MDLAELIVPIVAILSVFGIGGYVTLKIIQLLRDWLVGDKNQPVDINLLRKLEQYELQQQQIVKRLQNIETLMLDADPQARSLAEGQKLRKTALCARGARRGTAAEKQVALLRRSANNRPYFTACT